MPRPRGTKIKQTRKRRGKNRTRKYRGGVNPFTTHVKTVVYNSNVRPGKPFYRTMVYDEIDGRFFEGLQKFMINTVDETEEDLVAMREAWTGKHALSKGKTKTGKNPQNVVVYGYKIAPN
jgi:hypothetical protein